MSFDNESIFTKENLDGYLKELAKAFRKRNGTSMPAEIILVGGAAILVNYGFRAMTTDIDAIIHSNMSRRRCFLAASISGQWMTVPRDGLIQSRNLSSTKRGSAGTGIRTSESIKCIFCSGASSQMNSSKDNGGL